MDKTDRLRDYGLAFLLYEQGLGVCGYELIRELFIFVKLILNSYLFNFLFAYLDAKLRIKFSILLLFYNILYLIMRYSIFYQAIEPEIVL